MTRTVDKLHTTENSFGLDGQQRRARFAVNVGDGAIEGPYGVGVGKASAQRSGLPDMPAWGALDGFHALDTAGAKVALQWCKYGSDRGIPIELDIVLWLAPE